MLSQSRIRGAPFPHTGQVVAGADPRLKSTGCSRCPISAVIDYRLQQMRPNGGRSASLSLSLLHHCASACAFHHTEAHVHQPHTWHVLVRLRLLCGGSHCPSLTEVGIPFIGVARRRRKDFDPRRRCRCFFPSYTAGWHGLRHPAREFVACTATQSILPSTTSMSIIKFPTVRFLHQKSLTTNQLCRKALRYNLLQLNRRDSP